MAKYKAIKKGHRSGVSRIINRIDEKISQNEIRDQELHAAIHTLKKKRETLQQLDSQIPDIRRHEAGDTRHERTITK